MTTSFHPVGKAHRLSMIYKLWLGFQVIHKDKLTEAKKCLKYEKYTNINWFLNIPTFFHPHHGIEYEWMGREEEEEKDRKRTTTTTPDTQEKKKSFANSIKIISQLSIGVCRQLSLDLTYFARKSCLCMNLCVR